MSGKNRRKVIIRRGSLNKFLISEKVNLLIVSFGGTGSTTLRRWLEETQGYKITSPTWKKLVCHMPRPFYTKIPIIYLYGDPRLSYASLKRRTGNNRPYVVNQKKLSNNQNEKISDQNLWKLMYNQFNAWTKSGPVAAPILFLKWSDLFTQKGKSLLQAFLGKVSFDTWPAERGRQSSVKDYSEFFSDKEDQVKEILSHESRIMAAKRFVGARPTEKEKKEKKERKERREREERVEKKEKEEREEKKEERKEEERKEEEKEKEREEREEREVKIQEQINKLELRVKNLEAEMSILKTHIS